MIWRILVVVVMLILNTSTPALLAADPPLGKPLPWNYDEVSLTNGASFRGLILKETPMNLEFQVVRRLPGRPTVTLTTSFLRREIQQIKRLSDAERQTLQHRLTELDPMQSGERQRMDALEWQPADWLGQEKKARRYQSDQFQLLTNAPEEVSRRAAVRLEQIYAAFTRVLPPRQESGRPTTIFLAGTMSDYRQLLGPGFQAFAHPAVYDIQANRILCGSDLSKLGEELDQKRRSFQTLRDELATYETQVRKLYRNSKPDLDRFLERVTSERRRLLDAERANERAFQIATQRLFALLYHESFHSYVTNFVYPPSGPNQLPRWLNEGLAQLFEAAILEAGELRIDHADPVRLERVKQALRPNGTGLVPLQELLVNGKESFLAAHVDQQAAADKVYLTAWALTLYLTCERRLIGVGEFEKFLQSQGKPDEVRTAFQRWTGQDEAELERDLNNFLRKLPPDGSLPATK